MPPKKMKKGRGGKTGHGPKHQQPLSAQKSAQDTKQDGNATPSNDEINLSDDENNIAYQDEISFHDELNIDKNFKTKPENKIDLLDADNNSEDSKFGDTNLVTNHLNNTPNAEITNDDKNNIYHGSEKINSENLNLDGPSVDFNKDKSSDDVIVKSKESPQLTRRERKDLEIQKIWEENDIKINQLSNGTQFTVSQASQKNPAADNATDINIEKFSLSARGKDLFINAALKITFARRYGLVGPNGHGKTTLLVHLVERKLAGIPGNIDILLCEQEVKSSDLSAVNTVLASDVKRTKLLEEEKRLIELLESGNDISTNDKLQEVYEELNAIGANAAEAKARRILAGLGFNREMQDRATNKFSGGWRMRVSLARTLFIEPTLLLLDEPTNHLDLNAVIWLDNYLQGWKKTLLLVSHDQNFLNNVCTDVIHLDQQKLDYYRGNYDTFKKMVGQKFKEKQKLFKEQQKSIQIQKMNGLSKEKSEMKVKAQSNRKKGGSSAAKKAELDEEDYEPPELLKKPREYVVKFSFPNPPKLSPPIVGLFEVDFAYEGQPTLFKNLDFGINMDSRVAIVGPNGVGKSTFLNLLIGTLNPIMGRREINHRVKLGVYNQHASDQLDLMKSPVQYLQNKFNIETELCRATLGRYGLASHGHLINIADLSGGQKARVVFAELSLRRPDVLILDEPTNNLDIESIDALSAAINEFTGGVILVSHDARLIEETRCVLWVVENHTVNEIDGDFDDYRREILIALGEEIY